MARLLLPLALSAAAFAAAWWAGSAFPTASVTATATAGEAGAGFTKNSNPEPASSPAADSKSDAAEASKMPAGFARREAMLRALEITDIREIRRLFETSRPDGDTVVRLTRVWADQDPAGMWKWLEGGGRKSLESLDVSNIVLGSWFRADATAAMAAFRSADPQIRSRAAGGLLYGITSTDEGMRAKLLPYLDEIVAADSSGIGMTGKEAETMAMLGKLPPGTGRDTLLQSTAQNWMENDWKAASAWAAGLTEPLKSKVMAGMITKALNPGSRRYYNPDQKSGSHAEPECFEWAKQWFSTEASVDFRRKMGPQFVNTLAEKDPAAALEWAQDHLAARPLTQAIGKVLEQQAKKDPASARTLVEELPPGGVKQRAAFAAVSTPTAESVTWLIGQADKSAVSEWYQVASNWAFTDPAAYKKYLETADPASLPVYLVNGGIDNLIRKDAPGTLDWVTRTQTPKTAGTALENWSREDAPAAAAWLKDHAPATDWSKDSLNSLAGRYFDRSPAEAADWAVSLPAGQVRDTTVAALKKSLAGKTSLKPEHRAALEERLGKP
ncbi:MAG: hypothetical protein V4726_21035 [Verrucomicrobiota bacterium]